MQRPRAPPHNVAPPARTGAPLGVGRAGEEAGRLAVHDDEGRRLGHGHLLRLEGVEVDAQGVPGRGTRNGQGVEQAHMGASTALGLLAVPGQGERVGVVSQGQQQRHREGGARGQARPDGNGAGDPGPPRRSVEAAGAGARPPGQPRRGPARRPPA